jgi:hypothetical protein
MSWFRSVADEFDIAKIGDNAANFTVKHEISDTIELDVSENTEGKAAAELKVKF